MIFVLTHYIDQLVLAESQVVRIRSLHEEQIQQVLASAIHLEQFVFLLS